MAKYEPCPFCEGTGRRLVPPPVGQPGRQPAKSKRGKTHGRIATYQAGCRCDLCRAANREYKRGYNHHGAFSRRRGVAS